MSSDSTEIQDEILKLAAQGEGPKLMELASLLADHPEDDVYAEMRTLLYAGKLTLTASWRLTTPPQLKNDTTMTTDQKLKFASSLQLLKALRFEIEDPKSMNPVLKAGSVTRYGSSVTCVRIEREDVIYRIGSTRCELAFTAQVSDGGELHVYRLSESRKPDYYNEKQSGNFLA